MTLSSKSAKFFLLGFLVLQSLSAQADPDTKDYPEIYPFVPFGVTHLYERVERVSEDPNFIKNIFDIAVKGLNQSATAQQPWTSTYWPLNKGLIADPYYEKLQILRPRYELSWTRNYNHLTKRTYKVHPYIYELSQEELNRLAPSEKYDLLLGDTSFDLTNRLRNYMQKWGSKKEHGFLSSLDKVGGRAIELAEYMVENYTTPDGKKMYHSIEEALPKAIELRGGLAEYIAQDMVAQGEANSIVQAMPEAMEKAIEEQKNYVLKDKNSLMALWEGICHGWATAAGIVPRPLHSVKFGLPNGKVLNFYPTDIKGLASLLWANSLIQDQKFIFKDKEGNALKDENGDPKIGGGVIMQGLRCNEKRPSKDEWGRFYDSAPDYYSKKLEPRCVGVHPAIWHMSLVNIIGKQGRSFIVERKVKEAVDNHPLSSYKSRFFNPNTGDYGPLSEVIQPLDEADQFYKFRNPKTKFIVGVETTMTYLDWERPNRDETDSPEKDKLKDIEMLYDLELDAEGNIVGGQWRTTEVGKNFLNIGADRTQPDFFWTITKDWKKTGYFDEFELSEWKSMSAPAPADWKQQALAAHAFMYQQTHSMGWNEKCEVIHKRSDKLIEVPCEFRINKPQPLINVVNKLIELSRE